MATLPINAPSQSHPLAGSVGVQASPGAGLVRAGGQALESGAGRAGVGVEIRRVSVPLTQLARGRRARISDAELDADDRAVLRAMGLKPSASIEVCRAGQPCIVALSGICGGGCRIGLSKDLASRVMVDPDD